MLTITDQLLETISAAQAAENPRLCMNFNFHEGADSLSQRFLNALEPDTVLPVHRHRHTQETYVLLRGRLLMQTFDEHKNVVDELELDPLKGVYGVNIPKGCGTPLPCWSRAR